METHPVDAEGIVPEIWESDFITFPPQTDHDPDGSKVRWQLCYELIEGQWEGFVAILSSTV